MFGSGLFQLNHEIDPRSVQAQTLVVTAGSFGDVGCAEQKLNEHLLTNFDNKPVGVFDTDQLITYTTDRPLISFERDHFSSYVKPSIRLDEVFDDNNQPFLLLSGPEPDLKWEAFAQDVLEIIAEFGVQRTILAHPIPTPSPHTRPIQVTEYAGIPGESDQDRRILANFKMSSPFFGLLATRLAESNHKITGLVAHVPHYLQDFEFPSAAIALINDVSRVSGLVLPVVKLLPEESEAISILAAQMAKSDEFKELVSQYEHRYDEMNKEHRLPPAGQVFAEQDLPDADQIGKEIESYLENLNRNINPEQGGGIEDLPNRDQE